MRWLLLLSTTACAAGNPTISYRTRAAGTLPEVWSSLLAGVAQHEQIARIDEQQATVVTKPSHVEDLEVMYVVRLEIALPQREADSAEPSACTRDRCPSTMRLNRIVLTVTPYATRNHHAVANGDIPRSARDHASDVLWDIKEHWIADKVVEQGLPP